MVDGLTLFVVSGAQKQYGWTHSKWNRWVTSTRSHRVAGLWSARSAPSVSVFAFSVHILNAQLPCKLSLVTLPAISDSILVVFDFLVTRYVHKQRDSGWKSRKCGFIRATSLMTSGY